MSRIQARNPSPPPVDHMFGVEAPHEATRAIGEPVLLSSGPYEGQIIQAELEEIQHPLLGRKFAIRDRRPVDPPPIVRLKLYRIPESDPNSKVEITNFEEREIHGHMCHVDLFYAPREHQDEASSSTAGRRRTLRAVVNNETEPIEGALCGTTVAQAVNIGYEKQKALMFIFGDLSVKLPGFFTLRYRFFDLFSTIQPHGPKPILAERFGDTFQIFSTKRFPGLPASTALTKHVAMWGVRLSVRETPRKRRKPAQIIRSAEEVSNDDEEEGEEGSGSSSED